MHEKLPLTRFLFAFFVKASSDLHFLMLTGTLLYGVVAALLKTFAVVHSRIFLHYDQQQISKSAEGQVPCRTSYA